jgi:hypothetical protein
MTSHELIALWRERADGADRAYGQHSARGAAFRECADALFFFLSRSAAPPCERIAEIRAREQAASKAPWTYELDTAREGDIDVFADDWCMIARIDCRESPDDEDQVPREEALANAAFIAHARQDIPWLLAQHATLIAERDEAKGRVETLSHSLVAALERAVAAESARDEARKARDWPSEAQLEGLKDYVVWQGAAHIPGCPEDDTCDCSCKPMNDAVNSILNEWFDRSVLSPSPVIVDPPEQGTKETTNDTRQRTPDVLGATGSPRTLPKGSER